jgi:hypothetical protein
MTKIIFLDIDGPLVNYRTQVGSNSSGLMGKFDPIGVNMVNQLLQDFDAQLVISSTWRINYGIHMHHVLNVAGVHTKYLHDDDETPRGPDVNYRIGRDSRTLEIDKWLDQHDGIVNYLIIDDIQISKPHSSHAVLVDANDGITYHNYLKMRSILGANNV